MKLESWERFVKGMTYFMQVMTIVNFACFMYGICQVDWKASLVSLAAALYCANSLT